MKIGIFTYRQYPFISANTSIGYIIANELKNNFNYDVELIGYKQDDSQSEVIQYNGMPITFFNNVYYKQNYINNWLKNNIPSLGYFQSRNDFQKIIKNKNIDLLISVFNPIDTVFISEKIRIPVIYYQLDPFYQHNFNDDIKLKKYFINLLRNKNYFLTTEELYPVYSKDPQILPYISQIIPIGFPKLISVLQNTIDKNRISYIGTLYNNIRPSNILTSFAEQIPENFKVTFMGSSDNEITHTRIENLGRRSQDEARELMSKSDFLLNIGNNTELQLGSKLIDYLSTGHPIINLYQRKDCPTLRVLNSYPYKINICVDELINGNQQKNMDIISDFLCKYTNKQLSFSEVKKLYYQYTPAYITNVINDTIKKVIS